MRSVTKFKAPFPWFGGKRTVSDIVSSLEAAGLQPMRSVTKFKAPFPWFGGKRTVSDIVWSRLGADVANYVEPFFGSGAVLLNRPGWGDDVNWIETVNDRDGFISNFWRSVQHDPGQVAHFADWPVNENDLHARHVWLRERREALTRRLEGDPDYYDAKIAGWWVWGICCWIGGGWCDPETVGPWVAVEDDEGFRQLVQLGNAGRGVNRKCVHLGDAGRGEAGNGEQGLIAWMQALSLRLARVRVASGDWSRVCGPSPTFLCGTTAVFLDPPYSLDERAGGLYASESEHADVAAECREWALANGDNPQMRIALCGYDTEHVMPESWERYAWQASGGYSNLGNGNGQVNKNRETIWFSPHCLKPGVAMRTLFDFDVDEQVTA